MKTKLTAIILILILVFTILPVSGLAATSGTENQTGYRVSDSGTISNWKDFFEDTSDIDTSNAGRMWTDKSVYLSLDDFFYDRGDVLDKKNIAMEDEDRNFVVALSALSANKTIKGYSYLPSDTMFVLDFSNSMSNQDLREMITAVNSAINQLYEINNYNRIGVVVYNKKAQVMLPLDRYTSTQTDFLKLNSSCSELSTNGTLKTSDGSDFKKTLNVESSGTFIQAGLKLALDQFLAVEDTTITGEIQQGTKRIPVMVLMSDGEPSMCTQNYDSATSATTSGAVNNKLTEQAFLSQLTSSYSHENMKVHYEREPLFYTLGLGVSSNKNAISVLDPMSQSNTTNSLWNTFMGLTDTGRMTISVPTGSNSSANTVIKRAQLEDNSYFYGTKEYVDQYFEADDATELVESFEKIVETIEIQSRYYPTKAEDGRQHLDGYLSFNDPVGVMMDVKKILGMVVNDKLFTGEMLAHEIHYLFDGDPATQSILGTVNNPSQMGKLFIESIVVRMNIKDKGDETAEDRAMILIQQAYQAGQMDTASDGSFSNYFGWFAKGSDEDEDTLEFISFWDGDYQTTEIPQDAEYFCKSYVGMSDPQDSVLVQHDMMYTGVRVARNIKTGNESVYWNIPASLIPTSTYSIEFDGTSYTDARNIMMEMETNTPISLVYEVGLQDDINEYNIREKMEEYAAKAGDTEIYTDGVEDGNIHFYTNKWGTADGPVVGDNLNENFTPQEVHNNIAHTHFTPSLENERYYYTEDKVLLDIQGNTIVTNTGVRPDEAYTTLYIFKRTGEITADNKHCAEIITSYEKVEDSALQKAIQKQDGSWYIPKETQKRHNDSEKIPKTQNSTNTMSQAVFTAMFASENTSQDTAIKMHHLLGNNGTYLVVPKTGLMITKKLLSEQAVGETDSFTFEVYLEGTDGDPIANSSFDLTIYNEKSGYVQANSFETNAEGKGRVTIKADETAYISGIPTNPHPDDVDADGYRNNGPWASYTVQEVAHTDYHISEKSGESGKLYRNYFSEAVFTNERNPDTSLVIRKRVEYPSDISVTDAMRSSKDFTVRVYLASDNGSITETKIDMQIQDGNTVSEQQLDVMLDSTLNKQYVEFTIKDSQSVALLNIDPGTNYSVVETNLPAGYSLNLEKSLAASVNEDTNALMGIIQATNVDDITLVNEYKPQAAQDKILITGTKTLQGRDWTQEDNFVFSLICHDKLAQAEAKGTSLQGADSTSRIIDTENFNTAMEDFAFSKAGAYYFELKEEIEEQTNGIAYGGNEGTNRFFTVEVTDADLDGYYEISSISALDHISAVYNTQSNVWEIDTEFFNTYSVTKPARVTVTMKKELINNTNEELSKEGYTFVAWSYDEENDAWIKNGSEVTTNADGIITATMDIPADYMGQTLHFKITEQIPENKLAGMTYDTTEWPLDVRIEDNGKGGVSAFIVQTSPQNEAEQTNVYEDIVFTNTYSLDKAEVTLSGKKAVIGDWTEGLSGFKFELYETPEDFSYTEGQTLQTAQSDENGNYAFEALTYDSRATHYYVIKETKGTQTGMTYDESEYRVTVQVEVGTQGAYVATTNVVKTGDVSAYDASQIDFTNIYEAVPTELILQGTKTLVGRPLQNEEFAFDLYSAADYTNGGSGEKLQTVKNDENGNFVFERIPITKAGSYDYRIVENTDTQKTNVTYDNSVYLVTLTVKDNDGMLQTERLDIQKEDQGVCDSICFVNTYNEPIPEDKNDQDEQKEDPFKPSEDSSTPQQSAGQNTGDTQNTMLWMVILLCGIVGLLVSIYYRKKITR